ncbi:MAG: hypothetical protein KDA57_09605 [Planctomycetales bacterium]|nr:hypothetical protein [Planctomycetales bacterium]
MKLRDEFLRELQAIVGQTNRRVTVADGPRILRCEVDQGTALAAAVYEFILESKELAQVDTAILQQSSQSLCNRVNYLLEPISPIETDIDGCVVQMRSNPPQQNESGKYYYELFLRRGGSIALYRYEKQPGAIRSRVPVTLTHEVLGRLCEDFNATIEEILAS